MNNVTGGTYNVTSNAFFRKPKYTKGQVRCMRRQGYQGDIYGPPYVHNFTGLGSSTSSSNMTTNNVIYWG